MSDETATPLTDQALARLRKLAEGNGIAPDAIKVFGADEKIYTIKGVTKLTPSVQAQSKTVIGTGHSTYAKILPNFALMKGEVDKETLSFQQRSDWLPAALDQLRAQPAGGWGSNDVKIPLGEFSNAFAATEPCPNCRGQKLTPCQQCNAQGTVPCVQCQGSRYQVCPSCGGQGFYQGQPNQPCPTCSSYGMSLGGLRAIPCRTCSGTGQSVCPVCQGRRGVPCEACKGIGLITQEVTLVCGVETRFSIMAEGLPSGLRQGIDRLGFAKLADGHADIRAVALPDESRNDDDLGIAARPDASPQGDINAEPKKIPPEQHYEAQLPFAELRMDIAGKRAMVSVFGKRGLLLGVPAFLDDAAEPARKILRDVAQGKAKLESALNIRIMRDALSLLLAGKNDPKELRRIYPLGLSPQAASEIMLEMRRALNRQTVSIRAIAACLCALASGGLFAGYFMTMLRGTLTKSLPLKMDFLADFAVLALTLGISWFGLSLSTTFILQKHFRGMPISVWQKTGKTGYAMMGVIIMMFLLMAVFAPVKPIWFLELWRLVLR